jgi:predicted transcriptional regulator
LAAVKLLAESPKNTRQITDALKKSREHTARVMKELYEQGLVRRNDSTKPFVYQLTDEGRRHLSA